MSKSPVVAFGLMATTVALKAKVGRLGLRDQLAFAKAALEWLPAQDVAQRAAVDFLNGVVTDPVSAGANLQAFIETWCDDIYPPQLEQTLHEVEQEGLLAWQQRADLR